MCRQTQGDATLPLPHIIRSISLCVCVIINFLKVHQVFAVRQAPSPALLTQPSQGPCEALTSIPLTPVYSC